MKFYSCVGEKNCPSFLRCRRFVYFPSDCGTKFGNLVKKFRDRDHDQSLIFTLRLISAYPLPRPCVVGFHSILFQDAGSHATAVA
jgi:hypothetical protein